jgi:hypothetical protein
MIVGRHFDDATVLRVGEAMNGSRDVGNVTVATQYQYTTKER